MNMSGAFQWWIDHSQPFCTWKKNDQGRKSSTQSFFQTFWFQVLQSPTASCHPTRSFHSTSPHGLTPVPLSWTCAAGQCRCEGGSCGPPSHLKPCISIYPPVYYSLSWVSLTGCCLKEDLELKRSLVKLVSLLLPEDFGAFFSSTKLYHSSAGVTNLASDFLASLMSLPPNTEISLSQICLTPLALLIGNRTLWQELTGAQDLNCRALGLSRDVTHE